MKTSRVEFLILNLNPNIFETIVLHLPSMLSSVLKFLISVFLITPKSVYLGPDRGDTGNTLVTVNIYMLEILIE